MKPTEPIFVKLFSGVLYSDETLKERAFELLAEKYGEIDYKSQLYPFDLSDYYVPEMGAPIFRQFISFKQVIHPVRLPQIKIDCNELEDQLAVGGQRKVNLDPGYMDYAKIVLASAKYNTHKIYLDLGIYADTTMIFTRGEYQPTPYCFPDFKGDQYQQAFLHIRAKYKGQIRKIMRGEKKSPDQGQGSDR